MLAIHLAFCAHTHLIFFQEHREDPIARILVAQECNSWLSSIRVPHLDTKQQGHLIPGLKRLQDDHVKALTSTNICSSGLFQIFSLFPPAVQRGLGSQGQNFWQHFLSQNNSIFIRTSLQKHKLKVPSGTLNPKPLWCLFYHNIPGYVSQRTRVREKVTAILKILWKSIEDLQRYYRET